MKNKPLLALALISFCHLLSYSQITYEKGYIVDNNGKKTNCLIKNVDWEANPTTFLYRLSDSSDPIDASIAQIKEFGIGDNVKFERFSVDIDRSREELNKLSTAKNPEFNKEQLFLKLVFRGEASLYSYKQANLLRFFIKSKNSEIEQLVFKSYKTADGKVGANTQFKQQLFNKLKCEVVSESRLKHLKYTHRELVQIFNEYHECATGSSVLNSSEKKKRDLFNFSLRFGLRNSSLVVKNLNVNENGTPDFGSKLGFQFGGELELVLPFNKNKWSFIMEPTYQSFNGETENTFGVQTRSLKADYKSIELPIGARHYFFINNKSSVFVNAGIVFDFALGDSVIEFEDFSDLILDETTSNIAFGAGFNRNNKYQIELRYNAPREDQSFAFWGPEYQSISLILGVTLL